MASTSKHHHELTNGVGKCSVPMWMNGCSADFCDKPAYGKRPDCAQWRNHCSGETVRFDGRYNGYVPGLACAGHGGPEKPYFDFVCDGPPGPEAGRFVEVEDATGRSISKGKWVHRPDGYWALRVEQPAALTGHGND
jgi:hypothetical protein